MGKYYIEIERERNVPRLYTETVYIKGNEEWNRDKWETLIKNQMKISLQLQIRTMGKKR